MLFTKRINIAGTILFDFNLGYVKTTSLGSRKNDDRIDFLSKYGYALNSKLNVAGLFNFRSQLFKGYTYDNNAVRHYDDDVRLFGDNNNGAALQLKSLVGVGLLAKF